MRPQAFEIVTHETVENLLPFRSYQKSSRTSGIVHLALLSLLAGVIVGPQIGLTVHALSVPETRALIVAQPLLATYLTLALAFWTGLFAWPLRRLFKRVGWQRHLEITRDKVAVVDKRAFGSQRWTAPLREFKGIAHHVRASLSGTRHELILVHADSDRSVLLMVANHISAADITKFCRLLGLPEVPAKVLYSSKVRAETPLLEPPLLPAVA